MPSSDFQFNYSDSHQDYLLITVCGTWTMESARECVDLIRKHSLLYKQPKVLVNATEISTPESILSRYQTGEYIAKCWHSPMKVAFYVSLNNLNGLAMDTAINRGANVNAFPTKELALDWLLANP